MTAALRIVGEYQMFGDMEGNAWAHLVLGEARDRGLIQDYAVNGAYPGVFGIVLVCFTVDVPIEGAFSADNSYDEHKKAASDLLNGPVIYDSDVEVRWLSPVPA